MFSVRAVKVSAIDAGAPAWQARSRLQLMVQNGHPEARGRYRQH